MARKNNGQTKEKKNIARDLYVVHGHSVKTIEEIIGVHYDTISRWARDEEWAIAHNKMQNVSAIMAEVYVSAVNAMHREAIKPENDPDVMSKRIAHVKALEPSSSNYNDFTRLTTDITAFAMSKYPEIAKDVVELFKNYAKHKFTHLYD
jgi:hypothetical protein